MNWVLSGEQSVLLFVGGRAAGDQADVAVDGLRDGVDDGGLSCDHGLKHSELAGLGIALTFDSGEIGLETLDLCLAVFGSGVFFLLWLHRLGVRLRFSSPGVRRVLLVLGQGEAHKGDNAECSSHFRVRISFILKK